VVIRDFPQSTKSQKATGAVESHNSSATPAQQLVAGMLSSKRVPSGGGDGIFTAGLSRMA
jgi:hypothetical protein